MEQYNVTGMSCAACQARVEKAVLEVKGVSSCSVSLLTNSMGVEGNVSPEAIIDAVTKAGYGASLKGKNNKNTGTEELKDLETQALLKRLIESVGFLLVLMYFSMGHMMWGWPLPKFFNGNHVAMGLTQMLLTIVIMVINRKFFVIGFKGLIHKTPNMDTLVALGAGVSFGWSVYILYVMTDAMTKGNMAYTEELMMQFYFESAAMILTLITVGKTLEAYSKGKTTSALKGLMALAPKSARLIRNGEELTVSVDEIERGDIFVVRPGEAIPADGRVLEGSSAVNEAALSGESIPVDKEVGGTVSQATINLSGFLKCEATRTGEDTTLSQIIKMVSDSAATKAPIARIADKVSGIFVPAVISIAAITFIIWMIVEQSAGYSLARAISVLVISCPCALGLATPVAIMVGNGKGAKNGILFKTSEALEELGRTEIIVLDKTGTITKGEPVVTDIIPNKNMTETEFIKLAYSLEKKSEHPLSKAVIKLAEEKKSDFYEAEDFKISSGSGLEGTIGGEKILAGNEKFVRNYANLPLQFKEEATRLSKEGKTPLFFLYKNELAGIIAVSDVVKEDSLSAVSELKNLGLHVVMLTGDNKNTAASIAENAGVDEFAAGVLPAGKSEIIKTFKQHGKVAMVGDGINDAPALTEANVGIAIGAGTDVAIDAADVVLVKSNLTDVAAAIRLSRATLKNIHENLFWAFIYNIIGIPLAAGLYVKLFGWSLNPMFGAAAMSLSSFCVVSNALRLNLFKLYDRSKFVRKNTINENILPEIKEDEEMTTVLKVEGMMCKHCEAAVKKAIEAMPGVTEAVADHSANTVTVTGGEGIGEEQYKAVITEAGYDFKGIM